VYDTPGGCMINQTQKQFLVELTKKERDVFLFCFVCKISKKEASKLLKMPFSLVKKLDDEINNHIAVSKIQDRITELHNMI
jgi:hypothetical protein